MTSETSYAYALNRLREAASIMDSFVDVKDILIHRDEVIERYQPMFSTELLPNLDKEEFHSFLNIENNHHWTNLQRNRSKLTADMSALRNALLILMDESKPIEDRIDSSTEMINGFGTGTATAILQVAYPDRYGVWNNTSDSGLRTFRLFPNFERGTSEGLQYKSINKLFKRLSTELGLTLWDLDALWYSITLTNFRKVASTEQYNNPPHFTQGSVYIRKELHDEYGGQQQSGISTPREHNLIFLFTGKSGGEHGYYDGWDENGVFLYAGAGQRGDMKLSHGNMAIHESSITGRDLHLFEQIGQGNVRYVGQMVCSGHHIRDIDSKGVARKVIIFELVPIEISSAGESETDVYEEPEKEDLESLRRKALNTSSSTTSIEERVALVRKRSEHIRNYALERADGICEGCHGNAPFITSNGRPYLEVHHIHKLSDGGPDHPRYVSALCPNCHRRAHYGEQRKEFNDSIQRHVESLW